MSSREQRPYADGLGARARSHSRGHNRSPKQHKFVNQRRHKCRFTICSHPAQRDALKEKSHWIEQTFAAQARNNVPPASGARGCRGVPAFRANPGPPRNWCTDCAARSNVKDGTTVEL